MVIGLIIEFICKKEEDKKDMPVKISSNKKTDGRAATTPSMNDMNTLCEEIKKDNLTENSKVIEENIKTKVNGENKEKEANKKKNTNDFVKITSTNSLTERYIGIGINKSQLLKPKPIKASKEQIF